MAESSDKGSEYIRAMMIKDKISPTSVEILWETTPNLSVEAPGDFLRKIEDHEIQQDLLTQDVDLGMVYKFIDPDRHKGVQQWKWEEMLNIIRKDAEDDE